MFNLFKPKQDLNKTFEERITKLEKDIETIKNFTINNTTAIDIIRDKVLRRFQEPKKQDVEISNKLKAGLKVN